MSKSQFKMGALLSYISLITSNVISIVYTPVMLRLMGQSEYGIYNIALSLVGYLGIMDLGFGNAIIKYTSKYIAEGDREKEYNLNGMFIFIYSVLGLITLILGIFLVGNLNGLYSNSLSDNDLYILKVILILMIVNTSFSLPMGVFNSIILAYERFIFPKTLGIITKIVTPILVLISLLAGYGSIGMVIVTVVLNILSNIISMIYCFKELKIKIKFYNFDFDIFKEILNFSLYVFIAMIVDRIYWSTDQLILASVSGTTMVAIYSISSNFNAYYRSFSTAISGMFLPRITRMVSKGNSNDEISEIFIKVGRIQYIIVSFILCGFILVGEEFISIWAGEEYRSAYLMTLFVMVPLTIPMIQTIALSILQARNLHKFRAKVYFIIAILNLFTSIPLSKYIGGNGCALATGISIIIGHGIIMNIYYYKKVEIDIPLFWKNIIDMSKGVLISIGFTLVLYIIMPSYIINNIIIKGLTFTIVFIILIWNMSMNEYEKDLFRSQFAKGMYLIRKKYKYVS